MVNQLIYFSAMLLTKIKIKTKNTTNISIKSRSSIVSTWEQKMI